LFFFFGKANQEQETAIANRQEQIDQLEGDIDALILECSNNNGDDDEARMLDAMAQLESLNEFQQPNRSPDFLGEWHVWWTNCPPPSNGQLGPFRGTSGQVIFPADDNGDDESTSTTTAPARSYQNLLKVPPNDWLTATLDGVWEEWDGTLLVDSRKKNSQTQDKEAAAADDDSLPSQSATTAIDWGATHWKVTFQQLTIGIFGFPLFRQAFPPETSRIWRTTYLDDQIRIVRAGRTGRVQDEVVFYTKRRPAPPSVQ